MTYVPHMYVCIYICMYTYIYTVLTLSVHALAMQSNGGGNSSSSQLTQPHSAEAGCRAIDGTALDSLQHGRYCGRTKGMRIQDRESQKRQQIDHSTSPQPKRNRT